MDLRIGCTGWSYEGWVGTFYPKTMENPNHLKHYASVFDITEINSTFYRIPTLSMTKKWYNDTPQNFMFTAKLPKVTFDLEKLDDILNFLRPNQIAGIIGYDSQKLVERVELIDH